MREKADHVIQKPNTFQVVMCCDIECIEIDEGIAVHRIHRVLRALWEDVVDAKCDGLFHDAGISSVRERADQSQLVELEEIAPLIHDWPIPDAFKLDRKSVV
jgi:hypothetical protein